MILPVNFTSTIYVIVLHSVSIQHARFRIKRMLVSGIKICIWNIKFLFTFPHVIQSYLSVYAYAY